MEAFDGIVSAYAMDHLNRQGSDQSLAEAARVIKPRGDFLLMVIANEPWAKFTFGPLMAHGGTRGADWWSGHVQRAGFEIVEQRTRPLTLYLLAARSDDWPDLSKRRRVNYRVAPPIHLGTQRN